MAKRRLETEMKTNDYMDNDPTIRKGVTNLVTWFAHAGKTQVHIATANIHDAQLDMVIIPVNTKLVGQRLNDPDGKQSYGHLMPYEKKNVVFGDVVWSNENSARNWGSKRVAIAVVNNVQRDTSNNTMQNTVVRIHDELKRCKYETVGIQLHTQYDYMEFVRHLLVTRKVDTCDNLLLYLCTNVATNDVRLKDFMNTIDGLVKQTKLPRRLVSPKIRGLGIFEHFKVRTSIKQGFIQDTGCEALLAAIGCDLNLSKGGTTKFIAKAAGDDCQKHLDDLKSPAVKYWDVIQCPHAGQLNEHGVKLLIFGCLPAWAKNENSANMPMLLAKFIFGCLLNAAECGCHSIAIPLLGTNRLCYPERVVLAAILDGIELYAKLATIGQIERVVVIHMSGNDLNDLYISEVERRGSKLTKSLCSRSDAVFQMTSSFNNTFTVVNTQNSQVNIPIEYVQVFINHKEGSGVTFQSHMDSSKLVVDIDINKYTFDEVMQNIISICETEKNTAIVGNVSHVSVDSQMGGIVDAFQANKNKVYLYKALIFVNTANDFKNCKDILNRRLAGEFKMETNIVNTDNEVYIIKDTDNEDQVNKTANNDAQDNDLVRAEINHGIVQHLRVSSTLKLWKTKLESAFNVSLWDENMSLMIEGSLDNVVRVEEYLESGFPNDPDQTQNKCDERWSKKSQIDPLNNIGKGNSSVAAKTANQILNDNVTTVMKHNNKTPKRPPPPIPTPHLNKAGDDKNTYHQAAGKDSVLSKNSHANDNRTGKDNHNSLQQHQNSTNKESLSSSSPMNTSLRVIGSQDDHQHKPTNQKQIPNQIQMNANGNRAEIGSPYRFNDIEVFVYQSDITEASTDVIVCTDDAHFNHDKGLAKFILEKAGNDNLKVWRQSVPQQQLNAGDYVVTENNGYLKYKAVIHVIRPDTFGGIHQAYIHTLNATERSKWSSVAIPPIGTGKWPGYKEQCAEKYYQALKAFSGPAHFGTNQLKIHIVDINKDTIVMIRSVFDKLIKTDRIDKQRLLPVDDDKQNTNTLQGVPLNKLKSETGINASGGGAYVSNVRDNLTHAARFSKKIENQNKSLGNSPLPQQKPVSDMGSLYTHQQKTAHQNQGKQQQPGNEKDMRSSQHHLQTKTATPPKPKSLQMDSMNHDTNKGKPYSINSMSVFIYKLRVTEVVAEAIVCSDDPSFSHKKGIAKLIASRAGEDNLQLMFPDPKLTNTAGECSCIVTPAGNLHFQCIIHVIRPSVLGDIHVAFNNVLVQCRESRISSVAIPTLGAGNWPGSVSEIAQQYVKALQEFGGTAGALKEVHIVDVSQDTVHTVKAVFDKKFAHAVLVSPRPHDDHDWFTIFSSTVWITKKSMFTFQSNVKVLMNNCHFTEDSETIKEANGRCPALKAWLNGRKGKKIEYSEIRYVSYKPNLNCDHIMFAVRPWPSLPLRSKEYEKDVRKTVNNIITKVKQLHGTTVAIPVIVNSEDASVNDLCCRAMAKEFIECAQTSDLTISVVTGKANYGRFRNIMKELLNQSDKGAYGTVV